MSVCHCLCLVLQRSWPPSKKVMWTKWRSAGFTREMRNLELSGTFMLPRMLRRSENCSARSAASTFLSSISSHLSQGHYWLCLWLILALYPESFTKRVKTVNQMQGHSLSVSVSGGRRAGSREPSRPWPYSRPELVPRPGAAPQALWRIWRPGLVHCTVFRRCCIYSCWSSTPGQTEKICLWMSLDWNSYVLCSLITTFDLFCSPPRCTTCTAASRWLRTLCLLSTWGTVSDWPKSSDTCPLHIQTMKTSYRSESPCVSYFQCHTLIHSTRE